MISYLYRLKQNTYRASQLQTAVLSNQWVQTQRLFIYCKSLHLRSWYLQIFDIFD